MTARATARVTRRGLAAVPPLTTTRAVAAGMPFETATEPRGGIHEMRHGAHVRSRSHLRAGGAAAGEGVQLAMAPARVAEAATPRPVAVPLRRT